MALEESEDEDEISFDEVEKVRWYLTPDYKYLKHFVIIPFSL